MKFCKDCKYLEPPINDALPECSHPNNITTDPVTGEKNYVNTTARYCRTKPFGNRCGMNAEWFEAKDTTDKPQP